jgi:hypothetical protein
MMPLDAEYITAQDTVYRHHSHYIRDHLHSSFEITQLSIPTPAQIQRYRLKFIKNHLKNSYMFRSSTIFSVVNSTS